MLRVGIGESDWVRSVFDFGSDSGYGSEVWQRRMR